MFYSLTLPPYHELERYEGLGNYAIWKYYKFPFSYFYKAKLKLIVKLMTKKKYKNICDFGSGPGIFLKELKKYSNSVVPIEKNTILDPRSKFELIICGSILEFVDLLPTLHQLRSMMNKSSELIVASPMKTILSTLYFDFILDGHVRHSHKKIVEAIKTIFKVEVIKYWNGLYFALRAKI